MVFHRSLSDSKSLQVSRTIVSILSNGWSSLVPLFPSLIVFSNSTKRAINHWFDPTEHVKVIIIITPWEFIISANALGFSLEFERQQVSSNLQDSSQYSGRFHLCCSLDCLHSSSYFQVPKSHYQPLMTVPRTSTTIGITVTFMLHCFFQFKRK